MPVLLRPKGPFDLASTLECGQVFRWRREEGERWSGVVGRNVWWVRQAGRDLELESAPTPAEELALEARDYFRLDDDLRAFYRRLDGDLRVARAVRRYRGLRLIRQDPWECLVAFIVSAFSNIKRITHHIEQMSRLFGDPIAVDGGRWHTFPSAARLAELGEADFRELGLGYRSRFLARLPRALLDSGTDLVSLRALPYQDAKDTLLGIYGVGEKVADCVLAFSLDKGEAFPIDVWVRRVLLDWYMPGEKLTDRALRLWALDRFGSDGAYAQQYLFHAMRLGEKKAPARRGAG